MSCAFFYYPETLCLCGVPGFSIPEKARDWINAKCDLSAKSTWEKGIG
jgi:hypothetical protein